MRLSFLVFTSWQLQPMRDCNRLIFKVGGVQVRRTCTVCTNVLQRQKSTASDKTCQAL